MRYSVADLVSPHPSFRTFCPWTMLYESVLTPTHVQMILMGAPLNMITAVIRYILVPTRKSPHLSALCKWLYWGDFLLHLAHILAWSLTDFHVCWRLYLSCLSADHLVVYCDTTLTSCAFIWYLILSNTPINDYTVADHVSPSPSFWALAPWTMLYKCVLTPSCFRIFWSGQFWLW